MPNLSITPYQQYLARRDFLKIAAALGLIAHVPSIAFAANNAQSLPITDAQKAMRYNNYYEFTTNKEHVHIIAREFNPKPWRVEISGLVEKPISIDVEELPSPEERIYRFRCVEGWSMVVPWQGFSLSLLLEKAVPKAQAKYVRFQSVYRPSQMIGQRRPTLTWPYTEALRLDEAMHPLTILATGMYGQTLPNQNGAPIRLVVPWKYGFKSIKAIEKIELVEEQPDTTWNQLAPAEYGFYANVNPEVAHPRWSQRREVPLGQVKKVATLPFNGYEKEIAHLYKGMDLSTYF